MIIAGRTDVLRYAAGKLAVLAAMIFSSCQMGFAENAQFKNAAGTISLAYDSRLWSTLDTGSYIQVYCKTASCGGNQVVCAITEARAGAGQSVRPNFADILVASLDQQTIDKANAADPNSRPEIVDHAAIISIGSLNGVYQSSRETLAGVRYIDVQFIVATLNSITGITCQSPEAQFAKAKLPIDDLIAGITLLDLVQQ